MLTLAFVTLFIVFVQWSCGSKCVMRGLVSGKVKCVFHDRGLNVQDYHLSQNKTNTEKNITDGQKEFSELLPETLELRKYSTGLDHDKNLFDGDTIEEFMEFIHSVFPDVRWCGERGRYAALSHEDLVFFLETEKCCQKHDECKPVIPPKHSEGNITNMGLFPRFHCDCEKDFYRCLKKINKSPSNKIGFTYFTIFSPQCFREDSPAIDCKRKSGERCAEYKYDRTQPKIYQWFDIPAF